MVKVSCLLTFIVSALSGLAIVQSPPMKKSIDPCTAVPAASMTLNVSDWDCCGHQFLDQCGRRWLTTDTARRQAQKPGTVSGFYAQLDDGRQGFFTVDECGRAGFYYRLHVEPSAPNRRPTD